MKSEWKRYTLDEVCSRIYSGGTPSTKHPEYWNGNIKWLSSGETFQRFIYDTERKISLEGVNNSSTKLARKGCTVIATAGQGFTRGQASFLMTDTYMNQSVIACEADSDYVLPLYLYYNLDNRYEEFRLLSDGTSTRGGLSGWILKRMEIDLPSLEEQKKVVNILEVLDRKIELNDRINDNLLQQAQAIFMHKFGDNTSVTSATIADIALNVTDGVHNTVKDDPEGQYLLLSCKNIKGGLLSIGASERKINSETFEKLRRRTKLAKGDILISSVGTVGELLLLNTDPKNYEFQRSVAIVKPNPELVSSAYVYESLVAKKAELINAAHGAVQQCLFISDIAGFPIGIPNPSELRSFDEIVNPMFDTITANDAENLRLETLRDTLLPKLMSGELDVSDLDL